MWGFGGGGGGAGGLGGMDGERIRNKVFRALSLSLSLEAEELVGVMS